MNDEKYVFITDCADKKRTARGIHNKRTHNGKGGKVLFPSDYCKGNIIKYLWRYRLKNGAEDLRKARVYLNWMIEAEERTEEDRAIST